MKPTIEDPVRAEWDNVRTQVHQLVAQGKEPDAREAVKAFLRHLCAIRVLDPACGTGNFLYVTLDLFKRLEGEVVKLLFDLGEKQESLAMAGGFPVTPAQFLGIEVKPWAREIANLVLWIGYLQWQLRARGDASHFPEPVLHEYGNIECRDAVLAWDSIEPLLDDAGQPVTRWDGVTTKTSPITGERLPDDAARVPVMRYVNPREAEWPQADFVVGNPPYVGTRRMRLVLGDGYVQALALAYPQMPETADYVMYWWDRAAERTRQAARRRFGFITTNSITQSFNRAVLDRQLKAKDPLSVVFAIPDHPWVESLDGAAVRVAMTVGGAGHLLGRRITVLAEATGDDDEQDVTLALPQIGRLTSDLRAGASPAAAVPLLANLDVSFWGVKFYGDGFIVTAEQAGLLVEADRRPSLARPFVSGRDLTGAPRGLLAIDCDALEESDVASLYPATYQWILERVRPVRQQNPRAFKRDRWWIFGENQPGMRRAVVGLPSYVATTETAKHRVFHRLGGDTLAEGTVAVIALHDVYFLGVLSSRLHVVWALASGGTLEDRPRYNKTRCFDPFPFPCCTDEQTVRIRGLGESLDAHRKRQQALHPELTMTGMYNALETLRAGKPLTTNEKTAHDQGLVSVLKQIHDDLDAAVFDAYGWPRELTDEQILERLVALNAERAEEERNGLVRWLRPEFQNPQGEQTGQRALVEAGGTKAVGGKAAKAKPAAWPKDLPSRIGAVRATIEARRGGSSIDGVSSAFKGARRADVESILESLSRLGLARSYRDGNATLWSAVRIA